jgi:hypothetical protein
VISLSLIVSIRCVLKAKHSLSYTGVSVAARVDRELRLEPEVAKDVQQLEKTRPQDTMWVEIVRFGEGIQWNNLYGPLRALRTSPVHQMSRSEAEPEPTCRLTPSGQAQQGFTIATTAVNATMRQLHAHVRRWIGWVSQTAPAPSDAPAGVNPT